MHRRQREHHPGLHARDALHREPRRQGGGGPPSQADHQPSPCPRQSEQAASRPEEGAPEAHQEQRGGPCGGHAEGAEGGHHGCGHQGRAGER